MTYDVELIRRTIRKEWRDAQDELETCEHALMKMPDDEVWEMSAECALTALAMLRRIAAAVGMTLDEKPRI